MKRKQTLRRIMAVTGALLILSLAGIASAHPLGNFTVSRYSALTLSGQAVGVLYIVDMAEIPTFQERQAMDTDGDGAVSPAEETAWVDGKVAELAGNLRLSADGEDLALTPTGHTLAFPPGQGELETLRLEVTLNAALPRAASADPLALTYEDNNFKGRIGWQEVVATTTGGALIDSTVPATDLSDRLRAYPEDLLLTPPAVSRAEVRYAPAALPGGATADQTADESAAVAANRFSQDDFANLLNRTLDTPGALAAALLVAVGLGAAHALTPGHGKTIVGAYLVGSRGTGRHALLLGVTTTITHTAGVFALGFIVLAASEFILPETLYPWLGVMSGLLVVFIGGSILRGHLRHWMAHRGGQAHDHGQYHFHFGKGHSHDHGPRTTDDSIQTGSRKPGGALAFAGVASGGVTLSPVRPSARHDHHHDHGHDHSHPHEHDHSQDHDHHAPANQQDALSWRNLLALGISGGLLPCPSALVLMLSAIALRQVGLGMTLILAFSIGLAGVLTGIGLFMVYAGRLLEKLPVRHTGLTTRLLPIASATFITLAGLLITWRALGEAGVL